MELSNAELVAIERQALLAAEEQQMKLDELQLAFMGGGLADLVAG